MIELSTKPNENKDTAAIKKVLEGYLSYATDAMSGVRKKELNEVAAKESAHFLSEKVFSDALSSNPQETATVIAEKEKELATKAKGFGMREKINYAVDGNTKDPNPNADILDYFIKDAPYLAASAAVGAVAATALYSNGATAESAGVVLGAIALVPAAKIAKGVVESATHPRTEEQKVSSAEYTAIKHAQVALKQLKNVLKNESKAGEKAEYKQMVAECYAKTAPGVIGFLGKNGGR